MKILLAKYQISIYVTIKTQVASHGIFVENFERNHKTHTHKHKHTFLVHYWLFFLSFLQEISLAARKTLNVQLPYHSLRTVDSVKCLTLPTSILKCLEMENDSPSKQRRIQSPVKHER